MKEIQQIHDGVFNLLNEWSENARLKNERNPYFYLRSTPDDRFMQGYWFPGDETKLCISFWSGGDTYNRTPNVYFEINEYHGCRIVFSSLDSISKFQYFSQLANYLIRDSSSNIFLMQDFNTENLITIPLSTEYYNWNNSLSIFIHYVKPVIDEYIWLNTPIILEEFVSIFGFISIYDFETMYSNVLKQRNHLNEQNKSMEFYNKPKLPFALLGINIENFQGFLSAKIENLRPDAKWIFITGENGYGKTTLLQAIALGLSGDPELEKYLESNTRISIELVHKNEKDFPVRTKGNFITYDNYEYGQLVLGYGPARLNVQSHTSENQENKSGNNVLSLFDNETLLKNINYELFASSHSNIPEYNELEDLIKTVTKGRISEILIKKREVLFVETLSNGDKLKAIPLNNLAAGFRSIINIVIDIYLRFKKIHINRTHLEFYGIVLIDEIENHLHPILQKELPTTLSQVFPNIQFIISTHSPIPLLTAENNSIILKVDRTRENGVTIENIELDNLLSLTPNILFTSPIFGFSDIINDNLSNKQILRTEDTWDEMTKTDNLDKSLIEMYNKRKRNK